MVRGGGHGTIECRRCDAIFPILDGVHILLTERDAFAERERGFLQRFSEELEKQGSLARFRGRVERCQAQSGATWEKEDVAFWDSKYDQTTQVRSTDLAAGGDLPGQRVHRREKFFLRRFKRGGLREGWLLEVGSGEGETIQDCLHPARHVYNYVASDYSFSALRTLGRIYRGLPNVYLVQCTGSQLPFVEQAFDTILLFGILHHMPRKQDELPGIFRCLKQGGELAAFEAFERGSTVGAMVARLFRPIVEPEQSAHEERIDRDRFLSLARELGQLDLYREEQTLLLTALVTLFGSAMSRSVLWTKVFFLADDVVMNTLGRISRAFAGGAFYARVVKRRGAWS